MKWEDQFNLQGIKLRGKCFCHDLVLNGGNTLNNSVPGGGIQTSKHNIKWR
jgi:hypothetical protein